MHRHCFHPLQNQKYRLHSVRSYPHRKCKILDIECKQFRSGNGRFGKQYRTQRYPHRKCKILGIECNPHPKNSIQEHKFSKRHSLPIRYILKSIHIRLGTKYKLVYPDNGSGGKINKLKSLNKQNKEVHKAHRQIRKSSKYLSMIGKLFSSNMFSKAIHKVGTRYYIDNSNLTCRTDIQWTIPYNFCTVTHTEDINRWMYDSKYQNMFGKQKYLQYRFSRHYHRSHNQFHLGSDCLYMISIN